MQAVQEAVQEAVQAARDEGIKFDVRANLYTLLAISGARIVPVALTNHQRPKTKMRLFQDFLRLSVRSRLHAVTAFLSVMHAPWNLLFWSKMFPNVGRLSAGVVLYWRGIWTTWYALVAHHPWIAILVRVIDRVQLGAPTAS